MTRRFKAYDFKKDDPALKCIGTSWTRVWLNPNVVVRITQGGDFVRLQYEWMDIDRRVPIVDPTTKNPKRSNIPGMPGLGYSAAWYDGDALVIETSDIEPGYVSTMQEWAGLPQSRMMRTIERFTRAGDLLTIQITHVDPANYREPLDRHDYLSTTKFELMDYGCNPDDASVVDPRVACSSSRRRGAVAHHSVPVNFDQSKEITVTGVLTEIKWINLTRASAST